MVEVKLEKGEDKYEMRQQEVLKHQGTKRCKN